MKVLFVHGALVFDGAWWWHRMVEPLATLGLGSRAVELPSCVASPGASGEAPEDMYDDTDAVRAALEEEDEPVVLVGHSYGGMVITDAASGYENVRHLVYISSVMPGRDETLGSLSGSREPGPWMDPHPEDGTMGIKAGLMPDAFMQDCDEEAVTGALKRLTCQPLAVFGQSPRSVAWHEKPSTYVVCAEDRATRLKHSANMRGGRGKWWNCRPATTRCSRGPSRWRGFWRRRQSRRMPETLLDGSQPALSSSARHVWNVPGCAAVEDVHGRTAQQERA